MGLLKWLFYSVGPSFNHTPLATADGSWYGHLCCLRLYRKAFDSVPHAPLMKKLQDIGLSANLLSWLFDYLTQRKQQVVVDEATSNQVSVVSRVPQGSVLGLLLSSIYINGITEVSISPHSY